MKNHFVHTPCGPVQGAAGGADGVSVFRGIRYATAGRWEYPRQVTHWDGVYDAANFGACSFQPRAFYNEEDVPEKAFYYNEFRRGEHYDYSEDCLFLNRVQDRPHRQMGNRRGPGACGDTAGIHGLPHQARL